MTVAPDPSTDTSSTDTPRTDPAADGAVPPTLGRVVRTLDELYPPSTAEAWDAVGLVAGDPSAPVRKVLFAVDPVEEVADEALAWGADLLVTHHPLFLRPVHSVAATTFKGSLVHRLIRGGCGLYVAHTNADAAERGVADALADALDLLHRVPLVAHPALSPREAPRTGTGRVGRLAEPTTLRGFAQRVAEVLPPTVQGVRVAGDLDATVESVAVVGGSGDSLFDAVRASGADVYLTSDLRHHPVSELRERARLEGDGDAGTPFLVDVPHYASEWPWLRYAAEDLARALARAHPGTSVETRVSTLVTDPWTARISSAPAEPPADPRPDRPDPDAPSA
ncbi:Nif3-like dinuclear metal center hexameric protein [Cellulosimicrobium cellulans]|uniref:Nif3-like dinuclear metal center hexameric protein n=1 Tax=Cellulosimicrobium cellulans TaxID=1710 RepID=UPI0019660762|nr:Nif3-like dinuclear metal center hexameric protein [Cellulosimicrobium cellulans]MBN0042382.1 Nif3-like dinuclear metal center hexameric protein [Cellulosimicrobium cellulans]